jgi:hypothetical protein
MTIRERHDGSWSLDWGPPAGPFITLSAAQLDALVKALRADDRTR